ncbi:MAG: ABC transporter permease, partial [Burkholderiaceae bacterium]|nr:ABC transporter permease [Burkholderiaceae bacterium]
MSAVLSSNHKAAPKAVNKSEGVWHAAWRRLRSDKVGMVSMVVVGFFLLLVIASSTGLVAKNWQKEVGVPNAPPTFMGPAPAEAQGALVAPKGPNVDLSDIDPLAPKYAEWEERAKAYKTEVTVKAETLPLGGDRLGRDVLA